MGARLGGLPTAAHPDQLSAISWSRIRSRITCSRGNTAHNLTVAKRCASYDAAQSVDTGALRCTSRRTSKNGSQIRIPLGRVQNGRLMTSTLKSRNLASHLRRGRGVMYARARLDWASVSIRRIEQMAWRGSWPFCLPIREVRRTQATCTAGRQAITVTPGDGAGFPSLLSYYSRIRSAESSPSVGNSHRWPCTSRSGVVAS
ncbi:hypothetical protein BD413DRAFT_135476 [Trametes elegans]|nr:hypothetical protein BD413DRAFT_135476 [Trametes elegans]